MKLILTVLLTSFTLQGLATIKTFVGVGRCYIESLPCKDGSSISCWARGLNGGYCLAERKSGRYNFTCHSNAGFGQPRRVETISCKAGGRFSIKKIGPRN